jgi:hypothetical protein
VLNRQVHIIDEAKGGDVFLEAEQKDEAQMRQSMKQAKAERMKAVNDSRTVPLCADVPSKTVMIGTEVTKEEETRLLEFLHHNQDVFAWSKTDLTRVHRSVIEHALNTDQAELNKACPKDPYPLPRIDIIIDQAASCEMLIVLDCFSGYHQVWMRRDDEANTGFTTPFEVFCFVRMSEGFRNDGSTLTA